MEWWVDGRRRCQAHSFNEAKGERERESEHGFCFTYAKNKNILLPQRQRRLLGSSPSYPMYILDFDGNKA